MIAADVLSCILTQSQPGEMHVMGVGLAPALVQGQNLIFQTFFEQRTFSQGSSVWLPPACILSFLPQLSWSYKHFLNQHLLFFVAFLHCSNSEEVMGSCSSLMQRSFHVHGLDFIDCKGQVTFQYFWWVFIRRLILECLWK